MEKEKEKQEIEEERVSKAETNVTKEIPQGSGSSESLSSSEAWLLTAYKDLEREVKLLEKDISLLKEDNSKRDLNWLLSFANVHPIWFLIIILICSLIMWFLYDRFGIKAIAEFLIDRI